MSHRDDNNFLEMLKAIPVRRATPRVVEFTPRDVAIVDLLRERRAQGLKARIRNARGVVSLLRGTE